MVNANTLDLNLLRVFEAIARDRSVSAAASRLRLTQPAVSNALNRLRETFNDPLFVRTRHGMEPTEMARQLYDPIQHGLATIRAGLEQGVGFDPASSDRMFTLIMNDAGEITFLPPLLRVLLSVAPSVSVRVLELGRQEYEDNLDSGVADLAIGRIKLADTFRSQLIHTCAHVAILSSDHPLFSRQRHSSDTITMDEYLAARHVAVVPRGATGNPIEKALSNAAGSRRIALTVPHLMVLSAILPGTDLIATVPDTCSDALCSTGGLRWLKLSFEVEVNRVYQWWHKRQDQDAGHSWLREQIAALTARIRSGPSLPSMNSARGPSH